MKTGKRVCSGFLGWLLYSVLLAPKAEGKPQMWGAVHGAVLPLVLARVFSNTTVQKHQFFGTHLFYSPTFTSLHDHWKNHSLD